MGRVQDKHEGLKKRKARVGRKIKKAAGSRLRLNVVRSNKHIYANVVDDIAGKTVVSASTIVTDIKTEVAELDKTAAAKLVGERVGALAIKNGISEVVFDRGGNLYHGRVKALADGAREAGLKF